MSQAAEQDTNQHRQDGQYYRRVLHDLIDIGAELARLVLRQAQSQAEPTQPVSDFWLENNVPKPEDPTVAFDRVSRAIRRTIILARKLAEPVPTTPAHHAAARKHIIHAVEDTIEKSANGNDEAERLHAEFLDRLDAPDLDDDIASRPIADIITDICRDLGLDHVPDVHSHTQTDIVARATVRNLPKAPASGPANRVVTMRPGQPPISKTAHVPDTG